MWDFKKQDLKTKYLCVCAVLGFLQVKKEIIGFKFHIPHILSTLQELTLIFYRLRGPTYWPRSWRAHIKPEGPLFPLALQSGSWQPPSQTPVKVPACDSLPQQAVSLPPLSQTSWASQTIPITLRLFKQTAAQFPSPEPQLRESLGPTLTTFPPTPSHFQARAAWAETMVLHSQWAVLRV